MKRQPPPDSAATVIKTAELLQQLEHSAHEANRVGGEFCLTDIDAAMGMLDRADTATDPEVRQRNREHAQRAFDVVSSLAARLHLPPEQEAQIRAGLEALQARLLRLRG